MLTRIPLLPLFICILISSCNSSSSKEGEKDIQYTLLDSISIYGAHFDFYSNSVDTVLYLYNRSSTIDTLFLSARNVKKNKGVMASTHAAFFDHISSIDQIKGVSSRNYLYSQALQEQIENGSTIEFGFEASLDKEALISHNIEQLIVSGGSIANIQQYDVLKESGMVIIPFNDWNEPTPLDRASWVLVAGYLSGRLEAAMQLFSEVKSKYNDYKSQAPDEKRPKVIINAPYKGTWYVPGGDSYMSKLLEDAGVQYPWSDNAEQGAFVVDFESAYQQGIDSDFWINPSSHTSLSSLIGAEERVQEWKAVKNGRVFNSIKRTNSFGGNDYFEKGAVHPELLLLDIKNIAAEQTDHLIFFEQLH